MSPMRELRPFELLKLIRDEVVTSIDDLPIEGTLLCLDVEQFVRDLAALGWLEFTSNDKFRPTGRIAEVQAALRISLSQLAPIGNQSVVANSIYGAPEAPPTDSDVFVVMPFHPELRPVYDRHIRAVTQRLAVSVARADDFFAANTVTKDIWNAIASSRVIVADCTGRNANVFYEIGIAHTLGKPVVLISQNESDVPFDVRHIRTITYEFTPTGMSQFESTLQSTLHRELLMATTVVEYMTARSRGGA